MTEDICPKHTCFNCKSRVIIEPISYFNKKDSGRCDKRGLMAVQGFDGCDWWEEEGTTSTEEKIILLSKNISSLIVEVCSVHRANHLGHRHIIHDLTKINKEVISLIPEKDRWYYEI